ncbi:Lipopolysaccharide export system permease protein [Beijerinckiaceae bacterium RH AL1]|nr:LptF/LptG family permease [Beijerinckiaceae bacterium]VVB43901.1 Lipopolysaccharide export system permease protein [Beijerinckiaceae bacterium RH CH11]VVB43928.1 Lipopolysaccharide export system permease protein [Beijerinckiaceae bacterium RH AL8]VVC54070.1 Lipopolysaccharide export system permease protein [Beijerinckiaceae bacterium RH AL1]
MPKLLFFYLAKRMAVSALLIEVCLCVPVVMTSIFHYLPPTALRSGLLWPALLGTMPTVLYIALPIAVGVAVMLEFVRMSSEGMIAVLYSLRLSVWAICAPAAAVALVAVIIGYILSSWVAPNYVGEMHDVIYVIRNSLNHRMLEPAHFYTFDDGRRTMYFQRWKTPDIASNIFINQFNSEKQEEQIITADQAEFRRNEQGVVLVLTNGSIQTRAADSLSMRATNFEEYVMPIAMQGTGGMPKRGWKGVFEMPGGEFFADRATEAGDTHKLSEWTSEAAKRLGIPVLALAHVLFGIALVLTVSSATGRGSTATTLTILAVPSLHIGLLISMETLVRRDPSLVWIVAFAILCEFAASIYLLQRQNRVQGSGGKRRASVPHALGQPAI